MILSIIYDINICKIPCHVYTDINFKGSGQRNRTMFGLEKMVQDRASRLLGLEGGKLHKSPRNQDLELSGGLHNREISGSWWKLRYEEEGGADDFRVLHWQAISIGYHSKGEDAEKFEKAGRDRAFRDVSDRKGFELLLPGF